MGGALGSGMDLVIELGALFIERMVRQATASVRTCVSVEHFFRDTLLTIDSPRLQISDGMVVLAFGLRPVYGETTLVGGGVGGIGLMYDRCPRSSSTT